MFGEKFNWWKKPKDKEAFEKNTQKNNNSLKYESLESDNGNSSIHKIHSDEKYKIINMPMTGVESKIAGLQDELQDKIRDKSESQKTLDIAGGFEGMDSRMMLEKRIEQRSKEIAEHKKKIENIIQQN